MLENAASAFEDADDPIKKGHDILLRITGPENQAKTKEYDVFADRCMAQVTDTVGISGCVPNYSCLTTDVTLKVRDGEDGLFWETKINSAQDLAIYEAECQENAKRNYKKRS